MVNTVRIKIRKELDSRAGLFPAFGKKRTAAQCSSSPENLISL